MTVFSQDDRFFLRAQRRDMIHTSESEDDPNEMWKTEKTRSWMGNIINQDDAINNEQIEGLRKLL